MSSASISKIHVTNSTGLSLNDRFTAISTKPAAPANRRRSRSRSRSIAREVPEVDAATSMANRHLLEQLARRHKMRAALKLKRRSMRTAAAGAGAMTLKRGSVKALRVAPNGRPIKTNSLARVATSMNADYVTRRGRPLRRADSVSNRLGMTRRPLVGGAAERVARRRLERLAGDGGRKPLVAQRGRSRSRSRSRSRAPRQGGVASRPHPQPRSRSRSRSRSRARLTAGAKANMPVKARLGLRPSAATGGRRRDVRRSASISRRGIAEGRVEKRQRANGASGAISRPRAR